MYVERLPDYSAERYFLLSELEQKVDFVIFDEPSDDRIEESGCEMNMLYILINHRNISEDDWDDKVLRFVEKVIAHRRFTKSKPSVLVVEISNFMESTMTSALSRLDALSNMSILKDNKITLIVGFADNTAACPGLEKCYDILEAIAPGYLDHMMQKYTTFFAESRFELRGVDPYHEPDAVSGVYQAIVTSKSDVLSPLVKQVKKELQDKLDSLPLHEKPSRPVWQIPVFFAVLLLVMYFLLLRFSKG